MNKLIELLKVEAAEIETAFKKASIEGEGTPQEVSDRREEIVKRFVEKNLRKIKIMELKLAYV